MGGGDHRYVRRRNRGREIINEKVWEWVGGGAELRKVKKGE
jgi:hypothetical protein